MARPRASGLLITLEGGEGAGKTTQTKALASRLEQRGYSVCLTREPGGTELGQAIVRLLEGEITAAPLAELMLFLADRSQHVRDVLIPALEASRIVICDRFTDSTVAYQGYGRGLDVDLIRRLNDEATGGLKPHLTLLLDLPPEAGLAREGSQTDVTGRESLAFHRRVRKGFLALATEEPDRFVVIDASRPVDEITERAFSTIDSLSPPAV